MLLNDILNSDKRLGCISVVCGQDIQPGQYGPDAILLTDMVRSSSERFFTTDERSVVLTLKDTLRVHEVTEEFPACGSLEEVKVQVLGNKINGTTSRHGPGNSLEPALSAEEWDAVGVGNNNCKRIRWSDEEL